MRAWLRDHRALVQGILGSALAIGVALTAYFAYETNQEQGTQGDTLKVLVQSSPCSPTREHPNSPRDPAACKRNFAQGIKNLTPEQSCFILERGAPLINIGGKPIPRVTCVRGVGPPPQPRENKLRHGEDDTSTGSNHDQNPGSAAPTGTGTGNGGNGGGQGAQNPGSGGGQQPGGGGNEGGSPPASGGGGAEQPSAGGGGSGGEEAGGGAGGEEGGAAEGSKGGNVVEGVTGGLGEVVGGTLEGACTALDRLAGLCHQP